MIYIWHPDIGPVGAFQSQEEVFKYLEFEWEEVADYYNCDLGMLEVREEL